MLLKILRRVLKESGVENLPSVNVSIDIVGSYVSLAFFSVDMKALKENFCEDRSFKCSKFIGNDNGKAYSDLNPSCILTCRHFSDGLCG